jgi:hypothetical protein
MTELNELLKQIAKEQKKQRDYKHIAVKEKVFYNFRMDKAQKGFKSDNAFINYFHNLLNNDKSSEVKK